MFNEFYLGEHAQKMMHPVEPLAFGMSIANSEYMFNF
jgi:hypothetical protein